MTSEIDIPAQKETLWHKLRADLAQYAPEICHNNLLMCCCCGRFLSFDDFTIEHIVPQQALKDDPKEAKERLSTADRSQLTLLCNKNLNVRGRKPLYDNGCNSWKGRFFDRRIREAINGSIFRNKYKTPTEGYIVALLSMAYLALFSKFGYQVALTESGRLLREQFFTPDRLDKRLPWNCQMVLGADVLPQFHETRLDYWNVPFKFEIEGSTCIVMFRSFGIRVPISRDPRVPIAQRLAIKPQKYAFRPDFSTAFE